MQMNKTDANTGALSTDALLLAMVTLMIDQRERSTSGDAARVKTEILLANAGLTYQQIGPIMNKSPNAVRKVIERATKSQASKSANKGAE